MQCSAPGCEFKTPDGIPTYDQCLQSLSLHATLAHPQPITVQQAAAASKPNKLKRPAVSDGITEADWVWFEDRWARYKESTGLEGANVVNQLWDCASEDLARRCYEAGPSKDITEKDLLARMKKLAIKAQNKLVNIVEFLSMTQDNDEPVAMFLSRLKGQASVCDFTVKCSENAAIVHSYADNMVAHQLVRGLEDITQQEKVLALAATEKDLTLKTISEFVEAQETGLRSSKILGGGAGVQKIGSDYKRAKYSSKPSKTQQQERCDWCGRTGHGKRPSHNTRKEKCPAFGQKCHSCGAFNHFDSKCQNKSDTDGDDDDENGQSDDGQADAVAGIFGAYVVPDQGQVQRRTRRRHYTGNKTRHSKTKKIGKWNIATSVQKHELTHSQERREERRYKNNMDRFKPWSRTQVKLQTGDTVYMDIRSNPGTGIIMGTLPHNQYRVQSSVTGQFIVLNRQVLWKLDQDGTDANYTGNIEDYVLTDNDIDEDYDTTGIF